MATKKKYSFSFLTGANEGSGTTWGQQVNRNSQATGRLSDPDPVRSAPAPYLPPIQPIQPKQSILSKFKAFDIKGLGYSAGKEIGTGLQHAASRLGPVRAASSFDAMLARSKNAQTSAFGKGEQAREQINRDYLTANPSNTALSKFAEILPELPLWLSGEKAVVMAGKGIVNSVPKLLPYAQKFGKLPGIVQGGLRDAATFGSVVAPAQALQQGTGFNGLLQTEKQLPGVLLGGVGVRGAGKLIGKGVTTLRGRSIPNEVGLPPIEPIAPRTLPSAVEGPRRYGTNMVIDSNGRPLSRSLETTPQQGNSTILSRFEGEQGTTGIEIPVRSMASNIENPRISANTSVRSRIEPPQAGLPRARTMAADIETPGSTTASVTVDAHPQGRTDPLAPGGTADTFRAKVDRGPAKGRSISETLKGLRTQFVDDAAPLENVEKAISGKVASAEDSIYKQARLFRGSPGRADELIKSTLSPVLKKIEKSGKTTKDLGDYALAIHAKDVNAKGINSGFTNAEIEATIGKFGTPEMEASRKELMKISNGLLDDLASSGLIDKELVTALKAKHPNYMPLFRSFDDDKIAFSSGISNAMANVSAPINKLVGSDRNVIDPVESMIKNIYKSVSAIDRNKVAGQLGALADKDASKTIIRRLEPGEESSRLNTVYAMEDGVKVHYEVPTDVYKTLMNLDKESSNWLIKVLQKPAGLLRSGATLTPEFSLRNPIRDVVQAFTVSKSGLNPITDVPRALFDVIRSGMGKETMFNQFLKDNAGFGNIISMDRKAHQQVMSEILKQPMSKKFLNVVTGKSLINVLRTITDVTESATKLGEYRAALRSGASGAEAAYRARDLMDFARAGASVRETNKIIAFLNANIQGKSKLYRAIKENPAGVTARAFASITVPTMGVFMAQKYFANEEQKSIINDAPDWMTATFWLVPIPGTNQVARIPKPFDLAPIFANLPERAMKYIVDNDPQAFDGFAKQTMASASIPTMITGLIPFIEGMSNYSFFKQGPIIPQRESGINFPDQYDIRTTETAKFLAKGVNKLTGGQGSLANFGSPRVMDNTIRGATAGLGSYATSAIDFIVESTGLVDAKQKPARNISEQPLLRAFMTSEKSGGKSMGKLYDEQDKLTRNKGSLKLLADPKDVAYKNSPLSPQDERLKVVKVATGKIGDITAEMRKIENDKFMNAQLKRDKINALVTARNKIAKEAMGK